MGSSQHFTATLKQCIRSSHPVEPLCGISFYPRALPASQSGPSDDCCLFAVVGGHKIMVLSFTRSTPMHILQAYEEPTEEESFYRCAWTLIHPSDGPWLAVAGQCGIIHILGVYQKDIVKRLSGHGHAIHDLTFHPKDARLLFSASKDHSIRGWNVELGQCVLVFGGASGHVDEVLSISIHASGRFLASAGMDHAVKIWDLSLPHIQAAMGQGARVTAVHFCIFSNRHIHTNYVDSVRWFGDWVVSKAVGSRLCFWRPAVDLFGNEASAKVVLPESDQSPVQVVASAPFGHADIWYLPLVVDSEAHFAAAGNAQGQVWLWDVNHFERKVESKSGSESEHVALSTSFTTSVPMATADCKTVYRVTPEVVSILSPASTRVPVRGLAFSPQQDRELLAVYQDGSICRWAIQSAPQQESQVQ